MVVVLYIIPYVDKGCQQNRMLFKIFDILVSSVISCSLENATLVLDKSDFHTNTCLFVVANKICSFKLVRELFYSTQKHLFELSHLFKFGYIFDFNGEI